MAYKETIDKDGLLTIPEALRDAYGIMPNSKVQMEYTEVGLLISPIKIEK